MNSDRQSWWNPERALNAYALVFSGFIIWASLRTALNPRPHGIAVQILALVEVAGGWLFAIRRTRLFGLALLLAVFAIAAVIELHLREWPVRFVFYGSSAIFVQYLAVHLSARAKRRAFTARST